MEKDRSISPVAKRAGCFHLDVGPGDKKIIARYAGSHFWMIQKFLMSLTIGYVINSSKSFTYRGSAGYSVDRDLWYYFFLGIYAVPLLLSLLYHLHCLTAVLCLYLTRGKLLILWHWETCTCCWYTGGDESTVTIENIHHHLELQNQTQEQYGMRVKKSQRLKSLFFLSILGYLFHLFLCLEYLIQCSFLCH